MKGKKWFSLLCVALGATTLLAGCGGENSTPKTGNFTDEDFVKMSYSADRTYYVTWNSDEKVKDLSD